MARQAPKVEAPKLRREREKIWLWRRQKGVNVMRRSRMETSRETRQISQSGLD